MQTPNDSSQSHTTLIIKSLTVCPENDHKHHNSCVLTSKSSPTPPPSLSYAGDYIGMESCLDLKNCEDVHIMNNGGESKEAHTQCYRTNRGERWAMNKKEFPPPISLLARTENQPSRMPFVLKRLCTNDGRLILTEEKLRHHEYFRAHRSNGHLTLQIVPLDDNALFPPFASENESDEQHCNAEEEEEEEREAVDTDAEAEEKKENEEDGCEKSAFVSYDDGNYEVKVEEEKNELIADTYEIQIADSPSANGSTVRIGGNGGSGMCLNYNSVIISSSCFLGMPVPAIKPVLT